MNARILELIKNPEIIQNQDLDLLNSELNKHPYLQNIRALHLIGTHVFNPNDYQKQLSLTAAYTTDKKILYQLINKKHEREEEKPKEIADDEISQKAEKKSTFEEINYKQYSTAKPVFVQGELNRILFEGEEDFLERETEKIDIASTLESGKIVTQNTIKSNFEETKQEETVNDSEIIKEENSISAVASSKIEVSQPEIQEESEIELTETNDFTNEETAEVSPPFVSETLIDENNIEKKEAEIEDLSTISFHGLSEFLPEVKVNSAISNEKYELPKPQVNKHEVEMQRLIAEVEAKMKSSKKEKIQEKEIIDNHEVNFSENQRSDIPTSKDETRSEKTEQTSKNKIEEIQPDEKTDKNLDKNTYREVETEKAPWKPMDFSGNTPDSLLSKTSLSETKTEDKPLDQKPHSEQIKSEKSEDREALNVSFFTQEVSAFLPPIPPILKDIEEENPKVDVSAEDSNVPNFINTWQKWLKIERVEEQNEEKPTVSVPEDKNTAIEKFIEKEPRISKLKDESDFVVKERGSNISHLMTETLANLYIQQKLYSKAIKAYEILTEKHPLKEETFKNKIQEIKELRKNFNKENR